MTKLTIELSNPIINTTVGKDCELPLTFNISTFSNDVLQAALVNGFLSALNNIPRSNGQGEKPKTDKEWHKAKLDKIAVWAAGAWAATGRGGDRDSLAGEMREAFLAEQEARGVSRKAAEKAIRAKVKERFGEDESATFANYILALSLEIAEARKLPKDDVYGKLEGKYRELAMKRIADRKKANAAVEIDVDALLS